MHFINSLPADLPDERLQRLDRRSGSQHNAERRDWPHVVHPGGEASTPTRAYDAMERYLNRYGRGRLVRPIYEALAANGSDLELAREMFARARAAYHPYVKNGVARVLEVKTD